MRVLYERTNLIITEFDAEDVITTSGGVSPDQPTNGVDMGDNQYIGAGDIGGGTWF